MLKLVCFLHRRSDLDRESFHRHWREKHGPLIAGIPKLAQHVARYEQNPRLESDYARDDNDGSSFSEFDGATIMWFESLSAYQAYAGHPLYTDQIAPDEEDFLDRARTTWFMSHDAERKIGSQEDEVRAGVKLLALLKRRPDLDAAGFHTYWSGPHGDLFRETPELRETILAYQQNHRTAEDYARGDTRDNTRDKAIPWDGMAEQWYGSLEDFYAGAGGRPFTEIVAPDEEKFIDRKATRYILDRKSVV